MENKLKTSPNIEANWYSSYEDIPKNLEYPDYSLYESIVQTTKKYSNNISYDYFGVKVSYKEFLEQIDNVAKSFKELEIKEGDKVTICMTNTPEAIISFYALNKIGAISNMVHPLSAQNELKYYLEISESVAIIIIDSAYNKFKNIIYETKVQHIIVTSPSESMNIDMETLYKFSQPQPKYKLNCKTLSWSQFLKLGKKSNLETNVHTNESYPATILYTGGTTGKPKGVLLSNLNFNSIAKQGIVFAKLGPSDSTLSLMPIFHGFGLAVGIHTFQCCGGTSILIPKFNFNEFHKLFKKYKPTFLSGVPSLWESMINNKKMENIDLSYLRIVVSGGDSLSINLKKRMDEFLYKHNANVKVREGYGLTEALAGTCFNPQNKYKEGSIGIPYPDNYYKIVEVNTTKKVAYGEEGEICISGPSIMLEYLNKEEETANVLKIHEDGLKWLHTGDLGYMDEEGWVFFKSRIKRLIICNGYNIYPKELENIINNHPLVNTSTVIGMPHPYKIQVPKAYIILNDEVKLTDEVKSNIKEYCKKNLSKFSIPYEFEYCNELPKTYINKIDYNQLEK